MSGRAHVPPPGQSRRRSSAIWVLLAIAGLLLLLSSFAVWIDRVALNTGVFSETSSSLLDDRAIRTAVANRAVDELFANVDVQAEVKDQLPKDVKSLSGPASAGLRQASYQIVDRALRQSTFQRLFEATLEESHRTLVDVLEGGRSGVSTENGVVTLNLQTIIREAADRIGIGDQVADKIPADAGEIVVLRTDQLDTAQNVFELLKTLAWVLPILTLVAFGAAVALAIERRRTVRDVGIVLAVVGIVGLLAASLVGSYVVDSLVAQSDDRNAASNAWGIVTVLLRGSFRLMVVVGLLVVLAAWLAGPARRALVARGWLAPVLRARAWAYGALGLLSIVLLRTAEVSDFTRLLTILIVVALGVTWIELTRAQTLREFPDAAMPELVADARTRVSAWLESRRAAAAAAEPSPRPTPAQAAAATDLTSRLASLADLHARGELTDAEYASAKTRVLAGD